MSKQFYIWHTRDTGAAVIVHAATLDAAKAIVLRRYPHNPHAEALVERNPVVHQDLELIYIFGDYRI